jgi:hypothetical protein
LEKGIVFVCYLYIPGPPVSHAKLHAADGGPLGGIERQAFPGNQAVHLKPFMVNMGGVTDLVKGRKAKDLAKVNGKDDGGILGFEIINGFTHHRLGQYQGRRGNFLNFTGPGRCGVKQKANGYNKQY